MQFKVPQFLEIEDKIFGPFTFKEFVYLTGGAGICFVIYKLVGLFWGFIPILFVAAFSGALTFYKPNNKPFINMLESGMKFALQDKLYVWKRATVMKEAKNKDAMEDKKLLRNENMTKLDGSKLRDLAWSLDVLDLSKEQNKKNY